MSLSANLALNALFNGLEDGDSMNFTNEEQDLNFDVSRDGDNINIRANNQNSQVALDEDEQD